MRSSLRSVASRTKAHALVFSPRGCFVRNTVYCWRCIVHDMLLELRFANLRQTTDKKGGFTVTFLTFGWRSPCFPPILQALFCWRRCCLRCIRHGSRFGVCEGLLRRGRGWKVGRHVDYEADNLLVADIEGIYVQRQNLGRGPSCQGKLEYCWQTVGLTLEV